jgi:hypothetical protein
MNLTDAERLALAIERISQELGSVGLDPELALGLEVALGPEDVVFAESLAESLRS